MTEAEDFERRTNVAAVEEFYRLEEIGDLEGWLALWNEEGTHSFPISVNPAGRLISGKPALRLSMLGKMADRRNLELELEIIPAFDPRRIITRILVSFDTPGGPFRAHILFFFTFDEHGLLLDMAEYLNEAEPVSERAGVIR